MTLPHQSVFWGISDGWPTEQDTQRLGGEALLTGKAPYKSLIHPITIEYAEEIQQDLFWETQVKRWGAEAIQFGYRVLGYNVDGMRECEMSAWYKNERNWKNKKGKEEAQKKPEKETPVHEDDDDPDILNVPAMKRLEISDSNTTNYTQRKQRILQKMSRAISARFKQSTYSPFPPPQNIVLTCRPLQKPKHKKCTKAG